MTKKRVRVAIKFCGGCNPTFDRVEVLRKIRALAGDSIEWVSMDAEAYDAVLLIAGCLTACPEDELQHISRLVTVRDHEVSLEDVVVQLLEKGRTIANQDRD